MVKVQLGNGVTVSENLLRANYPRQPITLDESVLVAAEEARRRFGVTPFPTVHHYFRTVDSVRAGDSPLAAVMLHSGMVIDEPNGMLSTKEYDLPRKGREYRRHQTKKGTHSWRRHENSAYGSRRTLLEATSDASQGINRKSEKQATVDELLDIIAASTNRVSNRDSFALTRAYFEIRKLYSRSPEQAEQSVREFATVFGENGLIVLRKYGLGESLAIRESLGEDYTSMVDLMRIGTFVVRPDGVYLLDKGIMALLKGEGLKPNQFRKSQHAEGFTARKVVGNGNAKYMRLIGEGDPSGRAFASRPISDYEAHSRNILHGGYRDDPSRLLKMPFSDKRYDLGVDLVDLIKH